MKLLIATGLYPPESGGPATFAKLVETELGQSGFSITVIPFSRVRKYPKVIRHVIYFFILLKHVRGQEAILALDAVSVGVPAWLVSVISRKPLVVRLGGDYAWEQGRQRFGITSSLDDFTAETSHPLVVQFLRSIQTMVSSSAKRVIAPSEYLKSVIQSWGISPEKIAVVYSVSDVRGAESVRGTATIQLAQLDTEGHSPVLLSVSRLVPWKGFSTLIEVVKNLKVDFPNILLLIGGDGPEADALHQKIVDLDVSENVKLLGRLSRGDIEALSQQVDMFVLNTEYEGFSHLLVEFMALGVPIVTTNVGGNPELITAGQTGELVTYNDTKELGEVVTRLATDSELGKTYVRNAKERVKDFSKEQSLAKLEQVVREATK